MAGGFDPSKMPSVAHLAPPSTRFSLLSEFKDLEKRELGHKTRSGSTLNAFKIFINEIMPRLRPSSARGAITAYKDAFDKVMRTNYDMAASHMYAIIKILEGESPISADEMKSIFLKIMTGGPSATDLERRSAYLQYGYNKRGGSRRSQRNRRAKRTRKSKRCM